MTAVEDCEGGEVAGVRTMQPEAQTAPRWFPAARMVDLNIARRQVNAQIVSYFDLYVNTLFHFICTVSLD